MRQRRFCNKACVYLFAMTGMICSVAGQSYPPFAYSASSSASYDNTIAPGSLFVIFGQGLGPDLLVKAPAYPLQNQLGGTSVEVVSGSSMLDCPLFYSSFGAVAAVLPSNTPPGRASIVVTSNGQISPYPVQVNVAASAVGIFTLTSSGLGQGIFTALDGSIPSFAAAAKTGQTITAWGTGLGAISGPDNQVPSTFPNFPGVEVFVGNQSANVIYAGRSGCCAAVDQISFQIPASITGCYVPVSIRSGGRISNFTSIAISGNGGACSDAGPALSTDIVNRAIAGDVVNAATITIGAIPVLVGGGFHQQEYLTARLSALLHTKVDPKDVAKLVSAMQAHNERALGRAMARYAASWKALSPAAKTTVRHTLNLQQEGAAAAFARYTTSAVLASAVGSQFPSQGTCTVVTQLFGSVTSLSNGLDAGASLSLTGPAGSWSMAARNPGQYQVMFGSSLVGPNVPPGTYTLRGTGGKDVGAFTSTLNVSASIQWTNKSGVSTIDRTQPLTVTWTGGPASGSVLIGGYSDGNAEGKNAFACVEDVTKGSFSIPSFILSALSPTSSGGVIFIGPHPLSRQVTIPGIDLALFADGSNDSKSVGYR